MILSFVVLKIYVKRLTYQGGLNSFGFSRLSRTPGFPVSIEEICVIRGLSLLILLYVTRDFVPGSLITDQFSTQLVDRLRKPLKNDKRL